MDLSLLDALPPSPLFDDDRSADPFSTSQLLLHDPFATDDIQLAPPRSNLVLDPFDTPPVPLATVPQIMSSSPLQLPAAAPLTVAPPSPPQQENMPVNVVASGAVSTCSLRAGAQQQHVQTQYPLGDANVLSNVLSCCSPLCDAGLVEHHSNYSALSVPAVSTAPASVPTAAPTAAAAAAATATTTSTSTSRQGTQPSQGSSATPTSTPSKPSTCATATATATVSLEQKCKDKLAQRKLRNKESARRYREKQVARRRQLENYTRTLSEQNRELEILHHKLLTLTCQRSLRPDQLGDVSGAVM